MDVHSTPNGYLLVYLSAYCRVLIAIVFAYSSTAKLLKLKSFEESIVSLAGVRQTQASFLAILVVTLEVAVVALLLVEQALAAGFLLALALLTAFSVVLSINLARNNKASCNCFGHSVKLISRADLLRNGGLLLCVLVGLMLSINGFGLQLHVVGWILVFGVSALSLLLAANFSMIIDVLRPGKL
jgi:hypothetical protein